jgi:glycolate oxidase iron-sulfur subunit
MPGVAPVVVDSAGCGAAMKEYGKLLGSADAHAFSERVQDFSEWLAHHPAPRLRPTGIQVVIQDPCHLRHVQKAHGAVRQVLAPAYELLETADDGLCCGAGGAYVVTQPELSRRILDRKIEALRAAAGGADPIVASANPGCMVQLRSAGIDARHPADLIAEALDE